MSRAEKPVRLLAITNAHLWFRVERQSTRCMICREPLDQAGDPPCERCGLLTACFGCYIETIARSPKERAFWSSTDAEEQEALTRCALFLCPGCRS